MTKEQFNVKKAELAATILAGMFSDWTTYSNITHGHNQHIVTIAIHQATTILKECEVSYTETTANVTSIRFE